MVNKIAFKKNTNKQTSAVLAHGRDSMKVNSLSWFCSPHIPNARNSGDFLVLSSN